MPRHTTTSIRRPPAAASDAGRSRLGDLTRPIPVDKRLSRRPRAAIVTGLLALGVVGAIAAAVFVLPIGTWRDQTTDLEQRQDELEALRRVNDELEAETGRLLTDDGIREAAKEEIGYVDLGEQRSSFLPAPDLPTDLPDGWPYNVVTRIVDARSAGPAPAAAD